MARLAVSCAALPLVGLPVLSRSNRCTVASFWISGKTSGARCVPAFGGVACSKPVELLDQGQRLVVSSGSSGPEAWIAVPSRLSCWISGKTSGEWCGPAFGGVACSKLVELLDQWRAVGLVARLAVSGVDLPLVGPPVLSRSSCLSSGKDW